MDVSLEHGAFRRPWQNQFPDHHADAASTLPFLQIGTLVKACSYSQVSQRLYGMHCCTMAAARLMTVT
jgi:hypothetical protein